MAYSAYEAKDESWCERYNEIHKRVKAMWTLARREFGIRATFEFTFSVLNPETLAKLPHPRSHVIQRKEQVPLILLRVSKTDMDRIDMADTLLPQEMAHIVCKINPALGDPYQKDAAWEKVYKKLGGKC